METYTVLSLFSISLITCFLQLVLKKDLLRKILVYIVSFFIISGSIILASSIFINGQIEFNLCFSENIQLIFDNILKAVCIFVYAALLFYSIKYKDVFTSVLLILTTASYILGTFFVFNNINIENSFHVDNLSVILSIIVSVIGSLICIYTLRYKKDFDKNSKDKLCNARFFFFIYLLMFAMFIIIFSNSLNNIYVGLEIVTFSSFFLIKYKSTDKAIKSSFKQLSINLVGSLCFLVVLYICTLNLNLISLQEFINKGLTSTHTVDLPLCLLSIVAFIKTAQMPFHSWLLRSVEAPVSASCAFDCFSVVKAGAYLLIRLAPMYYINLYPQIMVLIIGGLTFFICSALAVSETNSERILVYSTISNMGLVTACCGVGTPEAIWAAIFLVIFHSISKTLVFLSVGSAQEKTGGHEVEDMDGLFTKMPRLARFMIIGMMSMFVAPFGMLISKWACLVSFVDSHQIGLIVILAFGSALTFVYWAKWLGKLAGIVNNNKNIENKFYIEEWISLVSCVVLLLICIICMPMLSVNIIIPYLSDAFSVFENYGKFAVFYSQYVTVENLFISVIFVALICVVIFTGIGRKGAYKPQSIYLSGAMIDSDKREFLGSMGRPVKADSRNMYLTKIFGKSKLNAPASVFNAIVIFAGCIACLFVYLGIL